MDFFAIYNQFLAVFRKRYKTEPELLMGNHRP